MQTRLVDLLHHGVIEAPVEDAGRALDEAPLHVTLDAVESQRAGQRQQVTQGGQRFRKPLGRVGVRAGGGHALRRLPETERRSHQWGRLEWRRSVEQRNRAQRFDAVDADLGLRRTLELEDRPPQPAGIQAGHAGLPALRHPRRDRDQAIAAVQVFDAEPQAALERLIDPHQECRAPEVIAHRLDDRQPTLDVEVGVDPAHQGQPVGAGCIPAR